MQAVIPGFILWLFCVWFETAVTGRFALINPNFFLLIPMVFILRWRGIEGYVIAIIWGLTADSFSSLPFGTNGLVFYLIALPLRYYGIKIFQYSGITLLLTTTFFTALNGLIQFIIFTFSVKSVDISGWFNRFFISEIIWTGIFSYPVYQTLIKLDKRFNIHLAERIF